MSGTALRFVAEEGNDILMWSITGSVPGRERIGSVESFVQFCNSLGGINGRRLVRKHYDSKIVNEGGGEFCQTLYYPAVVFPVREGMKLYREEQFGPLVPVMPFDDIETALDYVITSDHGQQVSVFGTDAAQIGALVDPLVNQVCRVNINCQCQRGPDVFPFAGRKDSAEGTLSVADALRAFSIRSMVAAKQTEPSKRLLNAIVQDHKSSFINTGFIL